MKYFRISCVVFIIICILTAPILHFIIVDAHGEKKLFSAIKLRLNHEWLSSKAVKIFGDFLYIKGKDRNADIILVRSKKDITADKKIKTEAGFILYDSEKKWRNVDVYLGENLVKARYKLHGSVYHPEYNSYTIETYGDDYKKEKFKLIRSDEFNYLNIFLSKLARKYELITEEIGEMVVVNDLERKLDYYKYKVMDANYLKNTYGLKSPLILKRNTFYDPSFNGHWHNSDLDNCYLNLDLKSIDHNIFKKWKKFLDDKIISKSLYDYYARYIAYFTLLGVTHQYTGNNERFIYDNDRIFPVARAEGAFEKISARMIKSGITEDSDKYSRYPTSIYKKLLTEPDFIIKRNLQLKKISDSYNEIRALIVDTYEENESTLKLYNPNYLKLKGEYKKFLLTLDHNIKEIKTYLNSGFTIIYDQKNKFEIVSSRNNPIEVINNNNKIEHYGYQITIDSNNTLIYEPLVKEYEKIENKNSYQVKDLITGKHLNKGRDFKIIYGF